MAKVEKAMLKDRMVMVQDLCEMIPNVSKTSIQKLLIEDLGHTKVCVRWIPKMLKEDHI